jgi:hypothetical protein
MAQAADRRLIVVYRPIDGLIPFAKNPWPHDDGHVAQIAASIRGVG